MTILLLLLGPTLSHAQNCSVKYDSIEGRSYYILTDQMPTYTEGFENLKKTINKNLKWPGARCCLDGAVYVSFVVEPDGRLTNRKVAKGLSNQPVCDADREALRVLTFLDGWIPGECDGKRVPVEVIIPIKFSL